MLKLLGLLGVGGAISLVVYLLAMQANERASIRNSLRQLDGYEVDSVRAQELLVPVSQRAIIPALKQLTQLGRQYSPSGYVESLQERLIYAGRTDTDELDKQLALRTLGVVGGTLWIVFGFILFPRLLDLSGLSLLIVVLGGGGSMILLPDARLNSAAKVRQRQIRIKLPDLLDLLTISVEAGLGFEQALDRVVEKMPGPLAREMARMLGEVRAGSTRADALRALDARTNVPEMRGFVLALLQADTFGVSIGRVLRSQADEMRVRRRQMAQEEAQKAPVKMLIPMVTCIFPSMFVVVLGPAAINIIDEFG